MIADHVERCRSG